MRPAECEGFPNQQHLFLQFHKFHSSPLKLCVYVCLRNSASKCLFNSDCCLTTKTWAHPSASADRAQHKHSLGFQWPHRSTSPNVQVSDPSARFGLVFTPAAVRGFIRVYVSNEGPLHHGRGMPGQRPRATSRLELHIDCLFARVLTTSSVNTGSELSLDACAIYLLW